MLERTSESIKSSEKDWCLGSIIYGNELGIAIISNNYSKYYFKIPNQYNKFKMTAAGLPSANPT